MKNRTLISIFINCCLFSVIYLWSDLWVFHRFWVFRMNSIYFTLRILSYCSALQSAFFICCMSTLFFPVLIVSLVIMSISSLFNDGMVLMGRAWLRHSLGPTAEEGGKISKIILKKNSKKCSFLQYFAQKSKRILANWQPYHNS